MENVNWKARATAAEAEASRLREALRECEHIVRNEAVEVVGQGDDVYNMALDHAAVAIKIHTQEALAASSPPAAVAERRSMQDERPDKTQNGRGEGAAE